jgi:NTE family protein
MNTRQILILQGGGALGAYECGVYQALAPHLDNLAVVAGTSIGAVNASLIAKHYHQEDRGVAALTCFWTEVLANPSFPFFPLPGAFQRWNAAWTSILFGNPHWFTQRMEGWDALFPHANPSFSSSQPMQQTLTHHFGAYGPDKREPRLLVTAVDIEAGTVVAFDSAKQPITAEHVVACGSLPPGYPAKEVAGKFYWDGGLWSNTPLSEILNVLQAGPATELSPEYQVYLVDVFPSQGEVPQNTLDVSRRMVEIVYADKATYDKKAAEWVNRYLSLLRDLESWEQELPLAVQKRLAQEYERICDLDKRAILHITHIKRSALPYEEISSGIDFSPERIKQLMAQGYTDASASVRFAPVLE